MDYFNALRVAVATGKEPRPAEVDRFAEPFSIAGEKQEKAADEATAVLLELFSDNPDIEKFTERRRFMPKIPILNLCGRYNLLIPDFCAGYKQAVRVAA